MVTTAFAVCEGRLYDSLERLHFHLYMTTEAKFPLSNIIRTALAHMGCSRTSGKSNQLPGAIKKLDNH